MPKSDEIPAQAVEEATKEPEKSEESVTETVQATDPTEVAARDSGWVPKDEYKGKVPWIDAKTWVDRAPLLEKISSQSRHIKEMKRTVDAMATHFQKNVEAEVSRRMSTLQAEKKEAIKEGDVEKVEAIDREIDKQKAVKADIPTTPELAPEIKDWVEKNSWYTKDAELHDFALAFNDSYLKRHPGDIEGSLKATTTATKKAFPEKFESAAPTNGSGEQKPKAPTVESGGTAPPSGRKYTTARLTTEQRLAHDQYIKAGTFKKIAESRKMSETEYFVRELESIGELTK